MRKCDICGNDYDDTIKVQEGKIACPYCQQAYEMTVNAKPTPILIIIGAVLGLIAVGLLWFGAWVYPTSGWLLFVIIGMFSALLCYLFIHSHFKLIKDRKVAQGDVNAFLERRKADTKKINELKENHNKSVQEKNEKMYNGYKYKCPMCGSNRIKNISTVKKSASVTAVGLASKTIGKNYQCDECKYMW